MSMSDRYNDLLEEKEETGFELAQRAGLIARCTIHDEIWIDQHGDMEEAEALVDKLLELNSPDIAIFAGNREEILASIEAAVDASGEVCNICPGEE